MLSNKQIKYLRGLANTLDSKYQIGKNEVTDTNLDLLDKALIKHELIKVQVQKSVVDDKNQLANEISLALHAEVVQIIGNVIVLFRKNLKEGKIHLPK